MRGRISKFTYGIPGWVVYKPSNPEHVKREHKTFKNAQGKKCVPGFFTTMLSKVWHQIILFRSPPLRRLPRFRAPKYSKAEKSKQGGAHAVKGPQPRVYQHQLSSTSGMQRNRCGWMLKEVQLWILSYDHRIQYSRVPKDKFEILCHVVADISAAPCKLTTGKAPSWKVCYSREYDVVLLVGLTELKAQIRWIDSTTVRIHQWICQTASEFLVINAGGGEKVLILGIICLP